MRNRSILLWLLFPFSLLYGLGVVFRNWMYKIGFLKSVSFDIPIISIGNLSMGGTGKTPHTEWLIQYLREYINVSVLSRGYKRKSKGFLEVQLRSTAEEVGDEPSLLKKKYRNASVYVGENRVLGIPKILSLRPETQVILLDDAFQHRAVKAGLNILLTDYEDRYTHDFLLPVGRLREPRFGASRADIIIVTKCPQDLTAEQRNRIIKQISPKANQTILFSHLRYGHPYRWYTHEYISLTKEYDVVLFCGIAKPEYLEDYLKPLVNSIEFNFFPDHHDYSNYDIAQIVKQFEHIPSERKILLTTEKDAVKLYKHDEFLRSKNLPIYVLPIQVSFGQDQERFISALQAFLLNFMV